MAKEKVNRSRRRFLIASSVAGAGLMLGAYVVTGGEKVKSGPETWEDSPGAFTPDAWLRIDPDGLVTVRVNHSEMGQGITTGLSMVVAEELDADWSRVVFEIAPAESVYKNPQFNSQMTASSTSLHTSWDILRKAGAAARMMLITAAAQKWGVSPADCETEPGRVVHRKSERESSYGELATAASKVPAPENVSLKRPEDYRLIGRPLPRLDTRAKVEGRAVFGIDVKRPGMLAATVIHPPMIGSQLKSFDSSQALKVPGVRRVLAIDNGLAVVADTFWQAQMGAQSVAAEWDSGRTEALDSARLVDKWAELAKGEGKTVYKTGDPDQALGSAARIVEAVYLLPYQAHATPEPMNCTAHVKEDGCDVWAPTQNQDAVQETAARLAGFKYQDVRVHTTYLGGGFGRRIVADYTAEAVRISKAIKAPVKVVWTREEDMRNDFYRPASYNALTAGLDEKGRLVSWKHILVGPDHMARQLPELAPGMIPYGVPRGIRNAASALFRFAVPRFVAGKKIIEGAAPLPYSVPNVRVDHVQDDPGLPTGFWRSVAHSQNAFVVECFLDEIVEAAGRDPLDFRLELLGENPSLRSVVELAAEKAGWGKPVPDGIFRGIAAHEFHGVQLCYIAEVSVNQRGRVKVHRMVCALDCGLAVNPKIIRAQISGGVAFGLSAALKSSISLRKGRVVENNFDNFPVLRMNEMPKVEVHIMPSNKPPLGLGEAGVPLAAPVVGNAVYAATKKRLREIPIRPEHLRPE